MLNLARTLGGFSVTYFQVPWALKHGALQVFGCEAAVVGGLFIAIVPALQWKGRELRVCHAFYICHGRSVAEFIFCRSDFRYDGVSSSDLHWRARICQVCASNMCSTRLYRRSTKMQCLASFGVVLWCDSACAAALSGLNALHSVVIFSIVFGKHVLLRLVLSHSQDLIT